MKIIAEPRRRRTGNIHSLLDENLDPRNVYRTPAGLLVIKSWFRQPNGHAEYSADFIFSENEALLIADRATF